jgi:hypothetical protein
MLNAECRSAFGRGRVQRIGGKTDVAIVAYIGHYVARRQIAVTLPIIELCNPRLYLPAHHDEIPGIFMDIGTEPVSWRCATRCPARAATRRSTGSRCA